MKVKIINKSGFDLPEYANPGDSGLDLRADLSSAPKKMFNAHYVPEIQRVIIQPLGRALIPTGIFVALPEGFEFQVRSRSGLALKEGIFVLNSPGTVDSKENFNFKYITN